MKKRFTFLTSLLLFSIITTFIIPWHVFAINDQTKEIVKINNDEFIYETAEKNNITITKVISPEGTIEFEKNNKTNEIKVNSDFLTEQEILDTEKQVNELVSSIDYENFSPSPQTRKPTGKWVYGKWYNRTVTPNGKATLQILIGMIGSAFGVPGGIAAGLANIMIQNGMKTGYFKVRHEVRRDTNPDYMWTRQTIKLYKDKARKKLLKTTTTKPHKVRVY